MMSDPFDADELWFARLLAEVPTPGVLERGGLSPAKIAPARRRRYRPLVVAGGLALLVGVFGGVGLGLTRAGGGNNAGGPRPAPARPRPGSRRRWPATTSTRSWCSSAAAAPAAP